MKEFRNSKSNNPERYWNLIVCHREQTAARGVFSLHLSRVQLFAPLFVFSPTRCLHVMSNLLAHSNNLSIHLGFFTTFPSAKRDIGFLQTPNKKEFLTDCCESNDVRGHVNMQVAESCSGNVQVFP